MTTPLENKIVSLAQARPPTARELEEFEPTPAQEALAAALNGPESPATTAELATLAGCDLRTAQRALRDPAFLSWTVSESTRLAEARLGAVHARLLHKALTEKGAAGNGALKLYLERFDPEYKKQKVAEGGGVHHSNYNFIGEMSDDELRRWVERSIRKQLGTPTPGPLTPPGD